MSTSWLTPGDIIKSRAERIFCLTDRLASLTAVKRVCLRRLSLRDCLAEEKGKIEAFEP